MRGIFQTFVSESDEGDEREREREMEEGELMPDMFDAAVCGGAPAAADDHVEDHEAPMDFGDREEDASNMRLFKREGFGSQRRQKSQDEVSRRSWAYSSNSNFGPNTNSYPAWPSSKPRFRKWGFKEGH